MKLKINIKGKEYGIEVQENSKGVKVKVNKKEFFFENEKKNKSISIAKPVIPKKSVAIKQIIAPIAGTISEIFVKEEQTIKKNGKVLALSAMKMENEIISDSSGKIKKILVKKNQKVQEGDLLITLK